MPWKPRSPFKLSLTSHLSATESDSFPTGGDPFRPPELHQVAHIASDSVAQDKFAEDALKEMDEILQEMAEDTEGKETAENIARLAAQGVELAHAAEEVLAAGGGEGWGHELEEAMSAPGHAIDGAVLGLDILENALRYKGIASAKAQKEALEEALEALRGELAEHPGDSTLQAAIDEKEMRLEELEEEIRRAKTFGALSSANIATEATAQIAEGIEGMAAEGTEFAHLFAEIATGAGVAASGAGIARETFRIKTAFQAIVNINKERAEIKEQMDRIRDSGEQLGEGEPNDILLTVLDLRDTYLKKIATAQRSGDLIRGVLGFAKSTGGAVTGVKALLAAKVAAMHLMGPIGAALMAGSLAISLTLIVEFQKAKISNAFQKIPKNISKKIHRHKYRKLMHVSMGKAELDKTKKHAEKAASALDKAEAKLQKLEAQHALHIEIEQPETQGFWKHLFSFFTRWRVKRPPSSTMMADAREAKVRAEEALREALVAHNENVATAIAAPETDKMRSVMQKRQDLYDETRRMDALASRKWEADQFGADLKLLDEWKDSLRGVLDESPETKAAIGKYLHDHQPGRVADYRRDPAEAVAGFIRG